MRKLSLGGLAINSQEDKQVILMGEFSQTPFPLQ